MADIYVNNAPFINKWFYVTTEFSQSHKGIDLAPTGYAGSLYAIDDFTVIETGTPSTGYGNYFIAKSDTMNQMYLYAHMSSLPPTRNTHFSKWQKVGEAGTTGTSTGVHLHLEMQTGNTWNYNAPFSDYINPTSYLTGINDVATDSDRYYFNGTPTPPGPEPPTPTEENKHKFPWFIYWNNGIF